MPKLPFYQNTAYPDASPLANAGQNAAQTGYYRGQMIEGGFRDVARGVEVVQTAYEKRQAADQKYQEQTEITDLTAKMAVGQADLALKWRDAQSQGMSAQDFMDTVVTPFYDGMSEAAQTPKGKLYVIKARGHGWAESYKSTHIDEANNQAAVAVENVDSTITSLSDAAYANPQNMASIHEQSKLAIDAIAEANSLKPDKVEKLRKQAAKEIAQGALLGMINSDDPTTAQEAIANGDFNGVLQGDELSKYEKMAEKAIKAHEKDANAFEKGVKDRRKNEFSKKLNDISSGIEFNDDGTKKYPANFAQNVQKLQSEYDDVASQAEVRAVLQVYSNDMKKDAKPVTLDDSTTVDKLMQGIAAGTIDRKDIIQAEADRKIKSQTSSHMLALLGKASTDQSAKADVKTINNFTKSMKVYLVPEATIKGGLRDQWSKARFAEYQAAVLAKWPEAQKLGWDMTKFQDWARSIIPAYQTSKSEVDAYKQRLREQDQKEGPPPHAIVTPELAQPQNEVPVDFFERSTGEEGLIDRTKEGDPNWSSFGKLGKVEGFIIHHTGGRGTVDGVIQTFKDRGYPAQFVIDREGKFYQTLPDGAIGHQIKDSPDHKLRNDNTIGVEIIARDDEDVTDVQKKAANRLFLMMRKKYGISLNQVYGHGEVNPGQKQATEGHSAALFIKEQGGVDG